jgi:hypothetical protein
MLPIPTAPVTAASEAAPRGQTLLRRAQASPWVSFLESGRVVLGVMVGDVMEHQLGVLEGPCWLGGLFRRGVAARANGHD